MVPDVLTVSPAPRPYTPPLRLPPVLRNTDAPASVALPTSEPVRIPVPATVSRPMPRLLAPAKVQVAPALTAIVLNPVKLVPRPVMVPALDAEASCSESRVPAAATVPENTPPGLMMSVSEAASRTAKLVPRIVPPFTSVPGPFSTTPVPPAMVPPARLVRVPPPPK